MPVMNMYAELKRRPHAVYLADWDTFQTGHSSVCLAFCRLNKKGYVQSEEREESVVAYWGTPKAFERNRAGYFIPREDGIKDAFYAARRLLLAALEAGRRKATGL